MTELDMLSDTEFRGRAIEFLDAFVRRHAPNRCPVKRAQITGLRQIAFNEPLQVKEFAAHQKARVVKRLAGERRDDRRQQWQSQIDFWELIEKVFDAPPARHPWSLDQQGRQFMPANVQEGTKKAQQDWLTGWKARHAPAFFQRFCAHYLYLMSQEPESEEER